MKGKISAQLEYWTECIANAAEECELALTADQLSYIAGAVENYHDNYGLAFYSPSSNERLNDIEREWKQKLKAKEEEHNRYVQNAELAIKYALSVHRDASVSIGEHGEVLRHEGRTTKIQ